MEITANTQQVKIELEDQTEYVFTWDQLDRVCQAIEWVQRIKPHLGTGNIDIHMGE